MDSIVTIPIKDVVGAELHEPAHFALIVSRADSDERVRLGFASADAGAFMLHLRQVAAKAALPGESAHRVPTLEAPRLAVTQVAAAPLVGSQLVEMTMRLGSGLHVGLAMDRREAAHLADQLVSALEVLAAPPATH